MKLLYVYILKCSDNSYYTGITNNIERRLNEHQTGCNEDSYTSSRRPVELMFFTGFSDFNFAISKEKQLKSWSRSKKEALIEGKYDDLINLAKKKFK